MKQTKGVLSAALLSIVAAGAIGLAHTQTLSAANDSDAVTVAALWQDRGDISSLNMLDGPGGKEHRPTGKFTFVEENKEGTSAKFDVTDEEGTRWRVKLGEETKSETAATARGEQRRNGRRGNARARGASCFGPAQCGGRRQFHPRG